MRNDFPRRRKHPLTVRPDDTDYRIVEWDWEKKILHVAVRRSRCIGINSHVRSAYSAASPPRVR